MESFMARRSGQKPVKNSSVCLEFAIVCLELAIDWLEFVFYCLELTIILFYLFKILKPFTLSHTFTRKDVEVIKMFYQN